MSARLMSLRISNFRSISGGCDIPLDADVILLHGLNGAGKTSILSGIELAATGTIAHLDRSKDKSYMRHLVHRGSGEGSVSLQVSGLNGPSSSLVAVTSDGFSGSPLLDGPAAEFFTERCFLPQTTLSRLLEIYAPGDGPSAQSPLVSFVKSLVGLDALDALIEGLDATAHVARAVRLSPSWSVALMQLENSRSGIQDAARAASNAKRELAATEQHLREAIGPTARATPTSALVELARSVLPPLQAVDGAGLQRMEIQLEASRATMKGLSQTTTQTQRSDLLGTRLLEWWTTGDGRLVLRHGAEAVKLVGLGTWMPETAVGQWASTLIELSNAIRRMDASIAARESLESARDLALHRVSALEARLDDHTASKEELNISADVHGLAELLASALPQVLGDRCPVCDQIFTSGADALREHIANKLDRLSEGARRALAFETTLRQLSDQLRSARTEAGSKSEALASLPDLPNLTLQHDKLEAAEKTLRRLAPLIKQAARLKADLDEARSVEAKLIREQELANQIALNMVGVAKELGGITLDGSLDNQLDQVSTVLRKRLSAHANESETRARIEDAIDAFDRANSANDQAHSLLQSLRSEELSKKSTVAEATRRKESASSLRREAERVRSASMRAVFDDNLNRAWSDLFHRLAPQEVFIPQFKRDDRASRTVNIELETIDQHGMPAASPGAMLSYGNVNTAALSLFLSLHFAVQPSLPWLLLDDPIQSMDDVHVANFAALMKQLTRVRGRQVVVAVHQRELFDYLKFELTPASSGEQLIAISIEKQDGSDTIVRHERLTYQEDLTITAA